MINNDKLMEKEKPKKRCDEVERGACPLASAYVYSTSVALECGHILRQMRPLESRPGITMLDVLA